MLNLHDMGLFTEVSQIVAAERSFYLHICAVWVADLPQGILVLTFHAVASEVGFLLTGTVLELKTNMRES